MAHLIVHPNCGDKPIRTFGTDTTVSALLTLISFDCCENWADMIRNLRWVQYDALEHFQPIPFLRFYPLSGERQDAAGLALGQTYEQLDIGVQGRFGRRGQENAEAVAPKPTG